MLSGLQLQGAMVERFARDVADHQLVIAHDDGLYRHLRFRRPDRSIYWFSIITWPGSLTIDGDMGTYTFARVEDMFTFFRGDRPNPQYWAEKLRNAASVQEYTAGAYRTTVENLIENYRYLEDEGEQPGLVEAMKSQLLGNEPNDLQDAHYALQSFSHNGFHLSDTWEYDMRDYTVQFLWCCVAIPWAIAAYDKAKEA